MYLRIISSTIYLLLAVLVVHSQEISLIKGIDIKHSVKIRKGNYRINGEENLDRSVITISGNDIVVDFNKSVLTGSNNNKRPDEFYGICIKVEHGKNIIIRNLICKGYKVGIIAEDVEGLTIENCDLSYNYRQHLNSTQEKEDISDWLSHHHNENNEWLRYGAAIYLLNCNNFLIKDCNVTMGQNGLLMTKCNNGMIYNNNFSFNSGLGIGMYRSSNNKVLYNKLDFNVRGYSDGVYNRGQDSAGILVYEQCNNNLIYKNSATHCGDGFFLWAGQTTMDSGKGGCNENIIKDNDFSYAPTNGIEVTFSSNKIIHNRIFECDNGIWGGYSYETDISDNQFRGNHTAIAIEHGRNNLIHQNLFISDLVAIKLWGNKEEPSNWGYPKFRDTKSRNYALVANSFNNNKIVYSIKNTDSVIVFGNRYSDTTTVFKTDSTLTNLDTATNDILWSKLSEDIPVKLPDIKEPKNPFKGMGKLQGRKNIIITEWGPYNFQYPLIYNSNPADTSAVMQFNIFGPGGNWRIISSKGLKEISKMKDSLPAHFSAIRTEKESTDIEIVAEFKGSSFKDQLGIRHSLKKPYLFRYSKFFQPIAFNVKWYSSKNDSSSQPFKIANTNRLNYAWWGGVEAEHKKYTEFHMIATGGGTFEPGYYELSITYNSNVSLFINDKLVLNGKQVKNDQYDDAPNLRKQVYLSGKNEFRIEHDAEGDFDVISLKINRAKQ